MSDGLDAPTVLRLGSPTLGQPVLSLDYRPSGERVGDRVRWVESPPVPTMRDLELLQAQLNAHETRLRALEQLWPVRLWAWLTVWWRS